MPKFNYIFFDQDISIKSPDAFELIASGGRRDKWTYSNQFKYKPIDKQWHLVSQVEMGFDSGEMKDYPTVTINEEELMGITASNFSYVEHYETSHWRVIADKSYFYTSPNLKSQHRKAYVIKGDILKVESETVNFVSAIFETKNNITIGFISKKDIEKIQSTKNAGK